MDVKIIGSDFDQELYNQKAPHPLQSWQWGEARKKMGIKVVRIGEFENNDVRTGRDLSLQNVYQLTLHKIPYTSYKVGYLPKSNFPSQEVVDFLTDLGKKNNVIFIKLEPNETIAQRSKILDLRSTIIKSPQPLFTEWTILLDLKQTEEELLAKMKQKTRYNIRLAEKKGVMVKEESTDQGFEIFSKLYFDTCRRQGYFGHNPDYHKTVWETLKNDLSHILIAYYENTPLAAYELFYFNKTLYYAYGGSSLKHRNLMGANLLMWEAIKLGKKLGAENFDMWGSLAPNYQGNDDYVGFTKFKEGYGGDYIQMMGTFDLVINNKLYRLYNVLNKLRNIFLQIKRRI
ncbi:MAG: peptidoglycan bridge formation glycyltransferase FemA/FemB family protein [Candidatus Roizmanbacteria bacterium]|nr:MAG: peptidoglycan bridge formation glycyltransferase FemA/FemB family protein [Candidatus Roizmanbacteria bacterium]